MNLLSVEAIAEVARLGGAYDWKKTPIEITSAARATDPLRINQGGNWWEAAEPRDSTGKKICDIFRSILKTGDGIEEPVTLEEVFNHQREHGPSEKQLVERARQSPTHVDKIIAHQRERERVGVDIAEEYKKYLPEPEDNAWAWANALATKVDTNTPESRPWYSALLSYVHKFPQTTKAKDLNEGAVARLVKEICDGGAHE